MVASTVVRIVETAEARRLAEAGAQLVEVLPAAEYEHEHLPGAVSLPLGDMDAAALERLDPGRPVVVYCYDHECDLSSRAAALLEAHGFVGVHDYAASKTAWLGTGLAAEGEVRPDQRAGGVARADVATCHLGATIGDLGDAPAGDDPVIVLRDGVVIGIVPREAAAMPATTAVADVLETAPPSVRPSITIRELASSMDRDHRSWVLVTTSRGRLLGVLSRAELDVPS